jgi:hypothetical protein
MTLLRTNISAAQLQEIVYRERAQIAIALALETAK